MAKTSKKAIILIALGLALIIAITAAFVNLYTEKVYWQEQAADYNIYHWDELYLMADKLEQMGITEETIDEMYLYINAKVFSGTAGIYPAFNGNSPYYSFLGGYYISLAQDIANNQDLSEEKLNEAIEIFKDVNSDLKALCRQVLDMAKDPKDKLALRDTDSELYAEVAETVKKFCNKHGEKISLFNHS